jgi:glycosyltransferase involved in cell wall biosynthesis
MPKVSVIIPNYNHASYLRQRVDSVLAQTFQDFEVILLDDCSTDESLEVIESYAGLERVKIVLNSANGGSVFKQWNKGLRMAGGEYVWIAESDDYASPEFLETLVGILEKNSNLGLAFCDSWRVADGKEEEARERWYGEFATLYERDFFEEGRRYVCRQMAFFGTIPNASAVVFRRFIAEQFGYANESYRLAGDWLFWLNLMARSDIAYSSSRMNYYRHHLQTARQKHSKDGVLLEESLKIVDFIFSNFPLDHAARKKIRTCWSEWFIEIMISRKSDLPTERLRALPALARRIDPLVDFRYFTRVGGLRRILSSLSRVLQEIYILKNGK